MSAHYYHPETLNLIEGGLREARKIKAFPSPTTILGEKLPQGLVSYIKTQTLQSALTLPRKEGENDTELTKRIIQDADEHRDKAAEFGTSVMKKVEMLLRDEPWAVVFAECKGDSRQAHALLAFNLWKDQNVRICEGVEVAVCDRDVGYAGTCDLLYRDKNNNRILADIKTQEWNGGKKKKPFIYTDWALQLAAYKNAIEGEVDFCKSVVLNSYKGETEEGNVIFEHTWSWREMLLAWHAFLGAVDYYKLEKKYDPTG